MPPRTSRGSRGASPPARGTPDRPRPSSRTTGSPRPSAGSPRPSAASPRRTAGSPRRTAGSPRQTGPPSQRAGSPRRATSPRRPQSPGSPRTRAATRIQAAARGRLSRRHSGEAAAPRRVSVHGGERVQDWEVERRLQCAINHFDDIHRVQEARLVQITASTQRFTHVKHSEEHQRRVDEQCRVLKERQVDDLMRAKKQCESFMQNNRKEIERGHERAAELDRELDRLSQQLQVEAAKREAADKGHQEAQTRLVEVNRKVERLVTIEREYHDAQRNALMKEREQKEHIRRLTEARRKRTSEVSALQRRAKELRDQINRQEAAKKQYDATSKRHCSRRDNAVAVAEQRSSKAQADAAALEGAIAAHTDHIEATWPKFSDGCPDADATFSQLAAADDCIHESAQQALRRGTDTESLRRVSREHRGHVVQMLDGLGRTAATLSSLTAAASDEVEPAAQREIRASETLVCCYPDPCPVGTPLTLLVTTCDASGVPVGGFAASDIACQQLQYADGAFHAGSDVRVADASPDGPSSTFSASFVPAEPGRHGFRATLNGVSISCSARVEAGCDAPSGPPAATLHCTPAQPLNAADPIRFTVVRRDPRTLCPLRGSAAEMALSDTVRMTGTGVLTGAVLPLPVAPLQRVALQSVAVALPKDALGRRAESVGPPQSALPANGHADPAAPDFVGAELAIPGGVIAATAPLPTPDAGCDWSATTISCVPEMALPGERVTVWITPRDSTGAARGEFPGQTPAVEPVGAASDVAPLVWHDGEGAWVSGFVAGPAAGRDGISVTAAGTSVSKTVAVSAAGTCVAPMTLLQLSPSSIVPGEPIKVQITTRDSRGRATEGPEPTALRLTALGGATAAQPVRRVDGSRSRYESSLRTVAACGHASAGCVLDFGSFSSSARVHVARDGEPAADGADDAASAARPPFDVQWHGCTEPLSEATVIIAPAPGRSMPEPRLLATDNCKVTCAPTPMAGAGSGWTAKVKVGAMPGSATVLAIAGADRVASGVEVAGGDESVQDAMASADRLREGITFAEAARQLQAQVLANETKVSDLQRLDTELKEREQLLSQTLADGEPPPPFVLFGVLLSDGVSYGGQWDGTTGARVVEVRQGGPLHQATQADGFTVRSGDVVTEMSWKDPATQHINVRRISQLADFRRVCRELGVRYPHGDPPAVSVRVTRGARAFTVVALTSRTADPPGRSAGTRRHPSKSADVASPSRTHARLDAPPGTPP